MAGGDRFTREHRPQHACEHLPVRAPYPDRVYALLLVYPLVAGCRLSLYKADFFGDKPFVGLENYRRGCSATSCSSARCGNTFYFLLSDGAGAGGARAGLALALNRHDADALRCCARCFFASSVLSVTIVTLLWRMVFLSDGGFIAMSARRLRQAADRIPEQMRTLALPAIAITTIWWCLGLPMMLFLAALQQVPRELYEAAALDNAGRWKTLWQRHAAVDPSHVRSWSSSSRSCCSSSCSAGAADDAGRAEQCIAADRAVHLRGGLQSLGHRLRRRCRPDPVRP